jgi:hypothetical protein
MLTEQRSLLSSLATTSLLGDKIPSVIDSDGTAGTSGEGKEQKEEEENRRKLAAILEKVEGCVVCILCHKYSDRLASVFPILFLRKLCFIHQMLCILCSCF